MGDVQKRGAEPPLQRLEAVLHRAPQAQVEGAEGLVEQQHGRVVDEGACQGYTLLFASRQFAGPPLGQGPELDEVESLQRPGLGVVNPASARPEHHVSEHVEVRKQRVALKHRVDVALVGAQVGEVGVAQANRTARGLLEPRHHAQRGGLTATGGAQQRHVPPLSCEEVDAVDSQGGAVALGQPGQAQVTGLGEHPVAGALEASQTPGPRRR